jgi:hypothetical protein
MKKVTLKETVLPVMPVTWEVEIRRSSIQGQPKVEK